MTLLGLAAFSVLAYVWVLYYFSVPFDPRLWGRDVPADAALDDLEPCRPTRIFPIEEGGSWGFINNKGEVAVRPQFDAAGGVSEGLALVFENGKVAFITEQGHMVIRTDATMAYPFSEGLAALKVGEFWGFIDTKGRMVIRPQFTHVMPFREGIAATNRRFGRTNWKAIDKQGKVLFEAPPDGYDHSFGWFSHGLAVHFGGDSFGYIGKDGRWAIKPQFDWASNFHEGLAAVRLGKKWGYIDIKGDLAIAPAYLAAGPFSEGLADVRLETRDSDLQVGFVDRDGKLVIQPSYDYARPFCEGLVAVMVGDKWGYADRKGTLVIPPRFHAGGSFSGGLAAVALPAGTGPFYWAYINRTGKVIRRSSKVWWPID